MIRMIVFPYFWENHVIQPCLRLIDVALQNALLPRHYALGVKQSHNPALRPEWKRSRQITFEAAKHAVERRAAEIRVDTVFEDAVKFYSKQGVKDGGAMLELPLNHN
ncbi:MAG: hypothetical protein QW190_07805 [Thermoproteota archaeon]